MKGRVNFSPPDYISMSIDWIELVDKPFKEGRIIEAFASADAIIDSTIESCLRQIYEDSKCQDLINEMHILRGRINFNGLIFLEILKSKTVFNDIFVQRVREFKKARNLILHSQEGEYALVVGNPQINYNSQKELNDKTLEETKKWIGEGFEIFNNIIEKITEVAKNKNYYFSYEFYQKNPRGKHVKNKFPKESKKKK